MYYTAKTISYSPLGPIEITATNKGICSIAFTDKQDATSVNPFHEHLHTCIAQLQEYFEGKRTEFSVPLDLHGTDFQIKVWEELLKIPFGKTTSYGTIAQTLNADKTASRAVGAACGKNKVWLVVPCHRVVSSTGQLTGYAGGIDRKKWLLNHEQGNKYGKQAGLFDKVKAINWFF